jgi:hypothetical protein
MVILTKTLKNHSSQNITKRTKRHYRRRVMGAVSFNYGIAEIPLNRKYTHANGGAIKSNKSAKEWVYIPLKIVNQLEKIAEYYNVSHKARGLQKPTKSDSGFLEVYRKFKGNPTRFENLPVKKANPDGEKWKHHRDDFCNRRYSMIKGRAGYDLYDPKTGLPSIMHTNMLMWACSPDAENIIKNVQKYNDILTGLKK